jgi:hypothetical protein
VTSITFRNPEVRLSEALAATRDAIGGDRVTLRELLSLVGEQGLLVFCAVLATPFLIPVSLPFASTVLGMPMLFIGMAVTLNRVPWLPDWLCERSMPSASVKSSLAHAVHIADRFEHLSRQRLLGLTATPMNNMVNGGVLIIAVVALMAPLPFVPLVNTLPAVAVILLSLGMAERDGAMILIGYAMSLLSAAYIAGLLWLATRAGRDADDWFEPITDFFSQLGAG